MKNIIIAILLILAMLLMVSAVKKVKLAKSSVIRTKIATKEAVPMFSDPKSVSLADNLFTWSTDGINILGTVESKTKGWLAVGFNGNSMGTVTKIVIGTILEGKPLVQIQAIQGRVHKLTDGKLIESNVVDIATGTKLTFKASLADLTLAGEIGKQISIISAHNNTYDLTRYHDGFRGTTDIVL